MLTKNLSIKEASKILGKSQNTVRKLIRIGKLKAQLVKVKNGEKYSISPIDLTNYLGNLCEAGKVPYQIGKVESASNTFEIYISQLYQDYQNALVRLGQLENYKLMITERAESLQKMEERYKKEIEELKEALNKERAEKEILIKKLEKLTRKKWWEFWKKPISQLLSSFD